MMEPENIISLAVLQLEVEQLRAEVKASTESTKALVEAWNTVGGVVRFVKWTSTLIAALGAIYLFVITGFKGNG